jgi:hypothetical protein
MPPSCNWLTPLFSVPRTDEEKRRIQNANNYRWNRARILEQKRVQREQQNKIRDTATQPSGSG